VTTEPPVSTGANHVTVAVVLPGDATTFVGAPGTPAGVTEADGPEETEVPNWFVAVTVNV
jgi:hypothetical protein